MKNLIAAWLAGLIVSCATSSDRDLRTVYQVDSPVLVRGDHIYFTDVQGNDFEGWESNCLIYSGTLWKAGADYTADPIGDARKPPLLPRIFSIEKMEAPSR